MDENPYRAEPLEALSAPERTKSRPPTRRLLSGILLFCGSCALGAAVAALGYGWNPPTIAGTMLFAAAALLAGMAVRR